MGKFKDEAAGLAVAAVGLGAMWLTGGAAAFAGASGWMALFQAAATTYGVAESRRQARRQRAAYNSSREDRMITTTSTQMSRRYAVGRTRLGGNLSWIGTSGTNSEYVHFIITLGDACSAIEQVFFDGEYLGPLDQYGFVQAGSKYFKGTTAHKTASMLHPGVGQTVTVGAGAQVTVLSVAYSYTIVEGENETEATRRGNLDAGTDYRATTGAGGASVTFLSGKGAGKYVMITYSEGSGTPLVRVYRYTGHGTDDQLRDVTLEADFPGVWTPAHRGRGVARLHIRMKYDPDVFTGGLPQVSARILGRAEVDIRNGELVLGANSPATVIPAFLMHEYGFRVRNTNFDLANLSAELSLAESAAVVPGADPERRYTTDGVIYADDAPMTTLRSLLTSNLGGVVWQAGVWRMYSAQYRAPVMALSGDDMVDGPVAFSSRQERSDVFNQVRGSYVDRDRAYIDDSYPPYRSQVYVTEDAGVEFIETLDLPYTQSPLTAQRLAKLHLLKARQATRLTARFCLRAMRLQVYDTVWLTLPYAGWENKVFRVTAKNFDPGTMSVELSLQEDAPQIYDETFDELTNPDPAPNTRLPDPRYVPKLSGFTANTDPLSYTVLPDGTISGHVVCKWDRVTASSVLLGGHLEIWWKSSTDVAFRREKISADATTYLLKPVVPRERINLYAFAVNGAGVQSERVTLTVDVNGDIPSNKVGAVLNQNVLQNAAFDGGGAGWRLDIGDVGGDSIYSVALLRETYRPVATPLPTTLSMMQTAPMTRANYISHIGSIAVDAGTRWCMQLDVSSINASAWGQVDFFDASGAVKGVETTFGSGVLIGTPDQFRQWTHLEKFFTVPDGVSFMRFAIAKSSQFTQTPGETNNTTISSFKRPMLSLASPDQTAAPNWSDGPPMLPVKWTQEIRDSLVLNPSPGGEIGRYYVPLIKGQRVTAQVSATISGVRFGTTAGIVVAAVDVTFDWRAAEYGAQNIGVSLSQDNVAPGVSFSVGGANNAVFEAPESGDATVIVYARGTNLTQYMRVTHVAILLEIL